MRQDLFLALTLLFCAASLPSRGEEPVVAMGKQRAERSTVQWDARDIQHPLLGPIRFAAPRTAAATAVTGGKVLSTVYVSCQKESGKVAIELSNAPDSDPAGGLRPTQAPRLVCASPGKGAGGLVKKEIAVKWEVRPLGDALARGIAAAELRRCVSIDVLQRVALPGSSPPKSQPIAMEIAPYDRALDSVFTACGEASAYAPPQPSPDAQPAASPWKPAHTTTKGRTNVRATTSVDSAIVAKLAPGTAVLARQTTPSWWEVRPRKGQGFRGYIREDRLAFD
ncbi:MAG: SH3 domain-containing protein [Betaproteobacteria bacterium]|nr:SH3 domain-containing protein [Betaproteobacteria bacterium]